MSHYLDTSVIVPLFVREAGTEAMSLWLSQTQRDLYLADLVTTEFNAVLSRLVRKGALELARADDIRKQFALWCEAATTSLENLPTDIRAAGLLVCTPQPRLLSADAIHLATCRRLGLTLVTADSALQDCAEREGVSWEQPG